MAITIAISGKGGSGKTTLAAMMVRVLSNQAHGAVLAVDADPNSCLGLALGIQPTGTVADVRESTRTKDPSAGGTDRLRTLELNLQQAVTEADGFDLLTMGRPEGQQCYCAVNNMLRQFLDKLSSQYQFVIVDNEAGMEHLSRRTTNNVDLLCIVAEAGPVGIVTARRISELAKVLPISVKQTGVIWNRTDKNEELDTIETFGCVPYDEAVFGGSMQGKTIFELQANSSAVMAVRGVLERKLNLSKLAVDK